MSVILVLLAAAWQGGARYGTGVTAASVSRLPAGAPARGITLAISPASIPPGVASQLTISVKDSSGRPLVGAVIALSGARAVAGSLTTSAGPHLLRVTPRGTGPVTVRVQHPGYVAVSGQIAVATPPAPALVSALRPSLQVVAQGVTLSRPATLREALQFQWRAVAGPTDRGSITFADGSVLDLDHNTTVLIKSPSRTFLQTGQVFLQIVMGGISHDIETGGAVAASLGTRYMVRTLHGTTTVTVLSGRVTVVNAGKAVSLGANQQTTFTGQQAPSAPSPVNAAPLVTWAAALPVAPDAALAHVAYLLLKHGTTLATFSLDSQQVAHTVQLPVAGVHLVVGQENDTLAIATHLGLAVVPLRGGKIHVIDPGINAMDLAALPRHGLAVADAAKDRVVVVNALTGATQGSIPLGYQPTGIAAALDGRTAIVVGTGEVSLVDLAQDAVITTRDVVGAVGRPAITPDGSLAYAVLLQSGQFVVLSRAARGIIATPGLRVPGAVAAVAATAGSPAAATVVGTDGRIYALDPGVQAVDVLDPTTNMLIARYRLPAQALSLALTQDGKLMIVTTHPDGTAIMDPTDGVILSQTGVGGVSGPQAFPPPLNAGGGHGARTTTAPATTTLVVSSVPVVETVQTQPHQFQTPATPLPTTTVLATTTPVASPSSTAVPNSTATSLPAATPTVQPACLDWNVGGNWNFTASAASQLGSGTSEATFEQTGSSFTGAMQLGDVIYSITGSLNGSSAGLTYSAPGQDAITDQGTISPDGTTISDAQGTYQGTATCVNRG
jgi:ferric-dicitrate binding protein FerR (iron transport regulator)